MISKNAETVNIVAAKNFRLGSEGAAEGGVGGIPPRPSAEAPPHRPNTWRAEPSRKMFSSF